MNKVFNYFFLISLSVSNFLSYGFLREIFAELEALSDFNRRNRELLVESLSDLARLPVEQKIEKVETSDPTPKNFDDLSGMPEEIREIVDFFNNSERFLQVGARMPRGILLYGPPGTGKTSIARVLAHECSAEFFTAKGSEFIEIYVGVGPKRVRELFEKARACEKAIIFIDEIDSVGSKRKHDVNREVLSTLNELLSQMDGYDQNANILVVAATNRLDMLDSALLRPGRFDRLIYIGLPDKKTRYSILKYYASFITYKGEDELLYKLAQKTEGFSGADLKNMVNEAAVRAARRRASIVEEDDFYQALIALKKT